MRKATRIKKGVLNIKHLVKAWNSHLIKEPLSEEQIRKIKICDACKHCVEDKWLDVENDEVVECQGTMCNFCGCPNLVLVRSNKKCELNKWEHIK